MGIKIFIDRTEAFRVGSVEYGNIMKEVTPGLLALLPEEVRVWLGSKLSIEGWLPSFNSGSSVSAVCCPPGVTDAILAEAITKHYRQLQEAQVAWDKRDQEENLAREQREVQRYEEQVAEVLATPIEAIEKHAYISPTTKEISFRNLSSKVLAEPRVKALLTLACDNIQKKADEVKRLAEEKTLANRVIIKAFLDSNGTASQQERFQADVLPLNELLDLAKATLFSPGDEYTPLKGEDIEHSDNCVNCEGTAFSSAVYEGAYGPCAWEALKGLKKAFSDTPEAKLSVRQHKAVCEDCGEITFRYGVRVKMPWAGHTLMMEFTFPQVLS